ncbi:outer membrane protein OmpA-like peptidoglycan-associated protein [Ancylobacter sp. 3268]|uniref:OmpA family protein n=1 Tax=Ancylobacter sp. 3268 TaxID=2817752 RepID=UPI00285A8B23|nr:OmpA family protein [Ancylobacter sp. 3268]MDR6955862.1 outer membrane protein OmpA-like peptidoglycan-associated protein [Ancylobacter sp. 3268]
MTAFTRRAAGLALVAALTLGASFGSVERASAQTPMSSAEITKQLSEVTQFDPSLTAQVLQNMAQRAVQANQPLPLDQSEIAKRLSKLAQIDVQIQFALNSAVIRPQSYGALGSIADAMHHPILWNYRFLVVGNTDTTGTRAVNLALSQKRAEAIKEALVNLGKVDPARLDAVGLGQEALEVPSKPTDPINRRVEIFTIGTMQAMPKPLQ